MTRRRTWGFRFSIRDAVTLSLAAVGAVLLWDVAREVVVLGLYTVGTFFVFCNIARIWRKSELVWMAVFVVNVLVWNFAGDPINLRAILLVQSPVTVGLVLWEMTRPRYHGLWARRLNPRLDEYLMGGDTTETNRPDADGTRT